MKKIGWKILAYSGALLMAVASQVAHPRAALSVCSDDRQIAGAWGSWSPCGLFGGGQWLCSQSRDDDYCGGYLAGYDCQCSYDPAGGNKRWSHCTDIGYGIYSCDQSPFMETGGHTYCTHFPC
jgi:hypothetical protein